MAVTDASTLHRLQGNQAPASDPLRNVWLSASAGTGKTQVLAARVWRLLLRGTDPGAILCLTFTKAGAAEMAARIATRLAHWVRASDKELFRDLEALGEAGGPDQRALARTLFAKVLDAPGGGLRIQTIHSFCQGLLAAFPVEAGLVPGFRPLDEREEAGLKREALADMLVAVEREGARGDDRRDRRAQPAHGRGRGRGLPPRLRAFGRGDGGAARRHPALPAPRARPARGRCRGGARAALRRLRCRGPAPDRRCQCRLGDQDRAGAGRGRGALAGCRRGGTRGAAGRAAARLPHQGGRAAQGFGQAGRSRSGL